MVPPTFSLIQSWIFDSTSVVWDDSLEFVLQICVDGSVDEDIVDLFQRDQLSKNTFLPGSRVNRVGREHRQPAALIDAEIAKLAIKKKSRTQRQLSQKRNELVYLLSLHNKRWSRWASKSERRCFLQNMTKAMKMNQKFCRKFGEEEKIFSWYRAPKFKWQREKKAAEHAAERSVVDKEDSNSFVTKFDDNSSLTIVINDHCFLDLSDQETSKWRTLP